MNKINVVQMLSFNEPDTISELTYAVCENVDV